MKSYLLSFKFNGVKNVDKEIQLNFYNKIIPKDFELKNYNIKSIFGPNCVGKTAFIEAIKIMQGIVLNKGYLIKNKHELSDIINKKMNEAYFEAKFLNYKKADKESKIIVTHYIKIRRMANQEYEVVEEKLFSDKHLVFATKNGFFTQERSLFAKLEKTRFVNTMRDNSVVCSAINFSLTDKEEYKKTNPQGILALALIAHCYFKISILFDSSDNETFFKYQYKKIEALKRDNIQFSFSNLDWNTNINFVPKLGLLSDKIAKDSKQLEEYLEHNKKALKYLQILNPKIRDFELEVEEFDDHYQVEKYIRYDDYRINLKLESSGLRKWIVFYNSFLDLEDEAIIIVDDLFNRLHDNVLFVLMQYLIDLGKGQLIFTTHNLLAMEVLKSQKKAIDFITPSLEVVSWIKNGNNSLLKSYRKGLIKDALVDVRIADFQKLFNKEQ